MGRYDLSTTTIGRLLEDPDAVAIVERHFPGVSRAPFLGLVRGVPATRAIAMASAYATPAEIGAIRAELEAL